MSSNALYTDLSGYYDLMCADIDYQEQSNFVRRIHQIFGNQGRDYLDLACGTGPHVKHFINYGYQAKGLDINQPMLDIAQQRNPEAEFILHDMSNFKVEEPLDLTPHQEENLDSVDTEFNNKVNWNIVTEINQSEWIAGQLNNNDALVIDSLQLFSKNLLPKLYHHNKNNLLWRSVKNIEDAYRAIELSWLDGLQPEDYHLTKLKSIIFITNILCYINFLIQPKNNWLILKRNFSLKMKKAFT